MNRLESITVAKALYPDKLWPCRDCSIKNKCFGGFTLLTNPSKEVACNTQGGNHFQEGIKLIEEA